MESCLACHKVIAQDHDVAYIVTFILDAWPSVCHPLPLMSLQSKALGIPHLRVKVEEPYRERYREAISRLMKTEGDRGHRDGEHLCRRSHSWALD
jgi:diphthamide synthase (EF-2-diphthine--ammonia ligase)